MMTAQQVIDAIHGSYATGSKNGHRNVRALLDALNVDQSGVRIIHVAGTNGKGSTCAMLASVLKAAGYRVGLYTSPFLQHYQERIRLDGVPMADELLVRYGEPLVAAAKELQRQDAFVTPFEMGTALALSVFAGEKCDFAVIEVGMGGRLDPTNIVSPCLCAITAIGLDHMGFLGDTLPAIAGEKAGIIKPGVPVVCYPADAEVRAVFEEAAADRNAPLRQLSEDAILRVEGDAYGSTATYRLENEWRDVRLSLPGDYQVRNAMTVLALAEELRRQGHDLPEDAVRRGLAETVWPARMEWACDGRVLIDGAHNPQGVAALAAYAKRWLKDCRRVLLSGVMADKVQEDLLTLLAGLAPEAVTVAPDNPRAMTPEEYAARLNALGGHAVPAGTMEDGLRLALELAGEDGVVIAAGSLYLAGEVRSVLRLPWK